jgi:hypothetical protein
MASLNPDNELQLFFNELFKNFDLTIEDDCLANTAKIESLRGKLS